MPSRKAAEASYFPAYQRAWEVSVELWPLWVGRLFYILLNYGAFLVCLMLTCWPLVSQVYQAIQGGSSLSSADTQSLIVDFFSRFKDFGFLTAVVGIFLFYLIWWTVISAWFNGGLYGRLTAFVQDATPFSWSAFVRDGFYHLIPMILLQGLLGTVLLLILGVAAILLILGWGLVTIFHSFAVLGVVMLLLSIAALILGLPFLIAYQIFAVCAQAALMEDGQVAPAFRAGYDYCLANKGMILKKMGLMTLGLWAAFLVFSFFFWILELIPLLGIIFVLINGLVRLAFYVITDVYFPALAVGLISQEKR
jgi:hypothetical protein